jgi:hypothetical protein
MSPLLGNCGPVFIHPVCTEYSVGTDHALKAVTKRASPFCISSGQGLHWTARGDCGPLPTSQADRCGDSLSAVDDIQASISERNQQMAGLPLN